MIPAFGYQINVDYINIDQSTSLCQGRGMGRSLTAAQAASHLGVRVQTLYAYVSRGQLSRTIAPDGRRSLFDVDELDAFAGRRRTRRLSTRRASLDVEIDTAITRMGEHELIYRDRSAVELAHAATFEDVAELLWGVGPLDEAAWRPAALTAVRRAARAATTSATVHDRLIMMTTRLAALDPQRRDLTPGAVARTGAKLISTLAVASGPPRRHPDGEPVTVADAVTSVLAFDEPELFGPAVERALILLADHELASSTLAVRVAASVRSDLYGCITAGLGVLAGPLHGGAAADARRFFGRCERDGVETTIESTLTETQRIPGFGHKIYRDDDPRWRPIVEAIPVTRSTEPRLAIVDRATAHAGARLSVRPNVDWASGALAFVAGLEPRAIEIVMALARMAGWTAHAIEEYTARPVRFRGVARYVPS